MSDKIVSLILVALVFYVLSQVQVPYTHPITELNPVEYNYSSTSPTIVNKTKFLLFNAHVIQITLQNLDSVDGKFGVNYEFIKDGIRLDTKYVKNELKSGESKIFEAEIPDGTTEIKHTLIIPVKQIQTTKTITEEVPLIKFLPKLFLTNV